MSAGLENVVGAPAFDLRRVPLDERASLTLLPPPEADRRWVTAAALKRILDVVVASLVLILVAPILAVAAVLIALESRGPVLFRQIRVGQYGRPFTMLKLRTMVHGADEDQWALGDRNVADGPLFKDPEDPRITRVGRWLRLLSIDELPQLVNVVRGDMSLVGPRPALPKEVSQMPEWAWRRLDVPQGMTGVWQVSGRYLIPFREGLRMDLTYIERWTPALDVWILVLTVAAVLSTRGAR